MDYIVHGADAKTGHELAIAVRADNKAQAERIARQKGILTAEVQNPDHAKGSPTRIKCANCERMLGKLERAVVHEGHIVCAPCKASLPAAADSMTQIEYRSAPVLAPAAQSRTGASAGTDLRDKYQVPPCPGCGSRVAPVKKAKGSSVLLVFLFLFFIVPAIIYLIFASGYVYVCPVCGMKRGDAA